MLAPMVSKESQNLQKFPACFILLLFLWGQMGAEPCTSLESSEELLCWVVSCTVLAWITSFESFSPLPSGFLSCLGLVGILNFECWHFKPMLCAGALLMNFWYNFPSFPWSFNQPYKLLKILQIWLQVTFWRDSGYSSNVLSFSRSLWTPIWRYILVCVQMSRGKYWLVS